MIRLKINKEYAMRICGVGLLMLAISLWSAYDGKVGYPRLNADFISMKPILGAAGMTPAALLEKDDSRATLVQKLYLQHTGRKPPKVLVSKLSEAKKRFDKVDVPTEETSSFKIKQNELLNTEILEKPLWDEHDLLSQFIMAAITGALALLAFGTVFWRSRKKAIYANGVFTGFTDKPFPWDAVEKIDDSQWNDKGIAILVLKDGRKVKLDAWHYVGVKEIVAELTQGSTAEGK